MTHGEEKKLKALWDKLEPDFRADGDVQLFEAINNACLSSMAISLKRIADSLDGSDKGGLVSWFIRRWGM